MRATFDVLYGRLLVPFVMLLGFATTLVVLAQIGSRHLMSMPFPWTEELSRFLFIWFCILGSVVALVRRQHLGIDYVVQRLPSGPRRVALIAVDLLIALFGLFVLVKSIDLMQIASFQRSNILRVPMPYVYLAFPVMGLFFAFHGLLELLDKLRGEVRPPTATLP
jgi:TRAP-type C4-dicarboxylate transport system permease small subunit